MSQDKVLIQCEISEKELRTICLLKCWTLGISMEVFMLHSKSNEDYGRQLGHTCYVLGEFLAEISRPLNRSNSLILQVKIKHVSAARALSRPHNQLSTEVVSNLLPLPLLFIHLPLAWPSETIRYCYLLESASFYSFCFQSLKSSHPAGGSWPLLLPYHFCYPASNPKLVCKCSKRQRVDVRTSMDCFLLEE